MIKVRTAALVAGMSICSLALPTVSHGDDARILSFPNMDRLWNSTTVSVCWENAAPQYQQQMLWVQTKIDSEYTKNTPLRFTGWKQCDANGAWVRIVISDDHPHTKGLGTSIKNVSNGMLLNFTFNNWSPGCKNSVRTCIENVAVHEFGHAIGLSHEQNRSDTFGANINNACTDVPQGSNGTFLLGPWDPDSVMNYCNRLWNNNGHLSAFDIEAINRIYNGQRRVLDPGYENLPRALVDVNGDGFKDYCRFVGNSPRIFLACKFSDRNGFKTDNDFHYKSIENIDVGYSHLPRYFADVNGDGRADYCRFVGNAPQIFLSCNLAGKDGFEANQYGFSSIKGLDSGYGEMPRMLVDVNGDRRADYCRFVGNAPNIFLACNLAGANGFGGDQNEYRSIFNIDRGYEHLPRMLQDVNSDGKADYCRYVGNKPNIFFSCNTAGTSGFNQSQYDLKQEPDPQAWYNK